MKKYDAMRLSGTILLAHLALCAAFLLLLIAASGSTSTFTFRSPYGLVLGLLFIGLPAFAFGWGLRSAKDPFDKKLCWNAAMVLYVLNAAAFLLAPEFGTGNVIAMWWGVPMAPALAGLNAFAAPQSALYLFGGALLAAVEPLCLTLGLLSGRRAENETKNNTGAPAEAAERTDDKEKNPMREMILCKLGEVVLKGLNRRSFEDKLIGNLRRRTAKCGNFRIYSKQSTIYVEPVNDESDLTAAYAACKQVFGVIAVSRALPCEKDVQAIIRTAKDYLAPEFARAKDFKVESKRADKTFPLTSIQLSQQVGGALHQAFPRCAVNVHDPELTVFIELRDDAAYVHGPAEAGAGGLPIGMGGSAVSLLSGGIDSPVASYMMAKRGVSLEMVHFFSPPYTSDAAKEKVLELAQLLTPWCGRLTVHIVPFTEIQEQIRMNCPEDHFTLIMRRFMMRLAQRVADEVRAKALVTGECLGQVASQTMEALRVSEDVAELPVLRPLIGMDKEEIIRISRKIGTFDTSILPYEDCCTVFTPRHPKTKPHVEEVRELEAVLDVDALCDRAMAGREFVRIKF